MQAGWEVDTDVDGFDMGTPTVTIAPIPGQLISLESLVPDAIIDALVETAWSLPGLRVSYGRFIDSRTLRFLASAGADDLPKLPGMTLSLEGVALRKALGTTDEVVAFEDLATDPRSRAVAGPLATAGIASMLLLPIRQERERLPFGVVGLDASCPRSWGRHEIIALDRLAPLVSLALTSAGLAEALARAESCIQHQERQLAAVRGRAAAITHDANIILDALRQSRMSDELTQQLEGLLHEVGMLGDTRSAERAREWIDLGELLHTLRPNLELLSGRSIHVVGHVTERIQAHRAGLVRLLVNLCTSKRGTSNLEVPILVSVAREDDKVVIRLEDPLGDVIRAAPAAADDEIRELHHGMELGAWLVHTEVLLHGGSIRARTPTNLELRLPA